MSNANTVVTSYKKETTYGTAATGNYQVVRTTGDSLKAAIDTVSSDEIGTRRVTDVSRTDYKVNGDVKSRWSYGNTDDFKVAAIMSDQADAGSAVITTVVDATHTLSIAASTPSLIWGGASPRNWTSLGYAVGDWVRVKGAVTNGSELYARITSISTTSSTNDTAGIDNFTPVGLETGIASGEVEKGATWTDGSTERSFSVHRDYGASLASNFRLFTGLEFNTWNYSVQAKGLAEETFGCMGQRETFFTTTQAGTVVAAPTNRLIEGVDHISAILNGGLVVSYFDLSMAITNNLRERNVFGVLGPQSLGAGQFNGTVNLNAYYGGNTQIAKYLAFTDDSYATKVRDASGNAYVMSFPAGNYTDASSFPEGNNQDVNQPLVFTSKYSPTYGCQFKLVKWDA